MDDGCCSVRSSEFGITKNAFTAGGRMTSIGHFRSSGSAQQRTFVVTRAAVQQGARVK